ncbi:endonuclease/exonuclease/phosphatase family protein [Carboxylicivirga taeanensis]|uniref:endonuclease/exonuclease/phosphatase family protein n=1 Tax=Carboxylicivirga taeanensis TaxID=1416875 RepID=UPI003F6DB5FA
MKLCSLFLFLYWGFIPLLGQPPTNENYAILFYNIENLFDCVDDSLKIDNEFLPEGDKRWSHAKMYKKINGISKTILACNGWDPPALIGLCEVENEWVLKQLIYNSGLSALKYKYIHYECDDPRGIDVALLYRSKDFIPLHAKPISLSDAATDFFTRDALYVKGCIKSDTVHLIINHWPSKRGGTLASEFKRKKVAKLISSHIDSIKAAENDAKLVLMGDFNSELHEPALHALIHSAEASSLLQPEDLNNQRIAGSYKYQGKWSIIDHILVANAWQSQSHYNFEHRIVALPFLLETDPAYSGVKPYRTYVGPRYNGGISDHLPVLLIVNKRPVAATSEVIMQ